jgi:hypothetical protein
VRECHFRRMRLSWSRFIKIGQKTEDVCIKIYLGSTSKIFCNVIKTKQDSKWLDKMQHTSCRSCPIWIVEIVWVLLRCLLSMKLIGALFLNLLKNAVCLQKHYTHTHTQSLLFPAWPGNSIRPCIVCCVSGGGTVGEGSYTKYRSDNLWKI